MRVHWSIGVLVGIVAVAALLVSMLGRAADGAPLQDKTAESIAWKMDLVEARTQAADKSRPLMIVFR